MPLLPELINILECVSTKMPPLTGLGGGDEVQKSSGRKGNGEIQSRAENKN
jgi:hypothetical protein